MVNIGMADGRRLPYTVVHIPSLYALYIWVFSLVWRPTKAPMWAIAELRPVYLPYIQCTYYTAKLQYITA